MTIALSAIADALAGVAAEFTASALLAILLVCSVLAVVATVALVLSWDARSVTALEFILVAGCFVGDDKNMLVLIAQCIIKL